MTGILFAQFCNSLFTISTIVYQILLVNSYKNKLYVLLNYTQLERRRSNDPHLPGSLDCASDSIVYVLLLWTYAFG